MPARLITSENDHEIAEIASPLRVVGQSTLQLLSNTVSGATPGFSPPNAWQRWVIDEVMLSASGSPLAGQVPVATLNAPFISTTVTSGGLSGTTQPLVMELFLNEASSPGNSIGSTFDGIFAQRKIAIAGSERLIIRLIADSNWAGVVITIAITGTRYQRRR